LKPVSFSRRTLLHGVGAVQKNAGTYMEKVVGGGYMEDQKEGGTIVPAIK